ncbi:MAG: OmpA family protein [Edaphocola sp.]
MANIIDLAKNIFTGELLSKASSSLGESESGVSSALTAVIPTILTGFLQKAGSSASGFGSLINTANSLTGGSGLTDSLLGSLTGGNNGNWFSKAGTLLQSIFGDKLGSVTSLISSFSGIKESSSSSLLGMAVPALLALVGRHGGNDEKGVLGFLNSQKENIFGAVPSGLNLSSALGLGSLSELGSKISSAYHNFAGSVGSAASTATQYVEDKKRSGNSWLWLLLLALAALAAWYFLKDGCNKPATDTSVTDTTIVTEEVTTTETPATTTRTLGKIVLNDTIQLDAYPGGIEDSLIAFIKSGFYKTATDEQLKSRWFNFDDLNFEFGTTKLTAESQRQLNNIIAILKAFPDVNLKIGGYTDKKGDDAANLKLSDERAKAVQTALKAAGVGAQVPQAEGYGEQFATQPEDAADEQRATDRKTSVRLVK